MRPIVGLIKCSYLCSVNKYLEPNIRCINKYCKKCGNKYKVMEYDGVHLSKSAKKYKLELINELKKYDSKLYNYDPKYALILTLIFVLNNRINKRDLDNLIKLTQDAIYEHYHINDVLVFELHVMKVQSKNKSEFVKFMISQSPKKLTDYII